MNKLQKDKYEWVPASQTRIKPHFIISHNQTFALLRSKVQALKSREHPVRLYLTILSDQDLAIKIKLV